MLKGFLLLTMVTSAFAGEIRLIGHTTNSKYITAMMKPEEYMEGLVLVHNALDKELASTLLAPENKAATLKLKKFSLGLATTGEVGIGPYKYGGTLKQRFVYSR